VAKSKFIPGAALTAGTRVYTEADGLYTVEQKFTGADGKETSSRTQFREGKETKQPPGGPYDTSAAKKVDANTWDFDCKTLTSHSTNAQRGGLAVKRRPCSTSSRLPREGTCAQGRAPVSATQ
jgi:hypothetical protein